MMGLVGLVRGTSARQFVGVVDIAVRGRVDCLGALYAVNSASSLVACGTGFLCCALEIVSVGEEGCSRVR